MIKPSTEKFNLNDSTYIRYFKIGKGKPILLLHTFRNRLEYSSELYKLLKKKFTVYVIDLPGFGDSPINSKTDYSIDFFTKSIVDFINQKKLRNLTIAGESIGAILAASVANKMPKCVKKIFMFNPYDLDTYFGEGISRGNFFSRFIFFHISLPVIGSFFSALENKLILKKIMRGGFYNSSKLSDEYLDLLCESLKKKGYSYHFRNVLFNFCKNSRIKEIYKSLKVPRALIYGEYDWANPSERLETKNYLSISKLITIKNSIHFSFLENPLEVSKIIM